MSETKIKDLIEYFELLNESDQDAVMSFVQSKLEILTEDTVCRDTGNNIYIAVTPDTGRNFDKDPYFKVSNKQINSTNPNVARISIRTGDYIVHNGFSIEVPPKIVEKINKMLDSKKYLTSNYSNAENGWDALLMATAKYCGVSIDDLRKQFPKITVNPNSSSLKNCSTEKWGK